MITTYPVKSPMAVGFVPDNGIYFRRFGTNISVGTSYITVDNIGATLPYMPSTSLKFEAVSSSVNDTAAGTGARTIEVTGVDTNWQEKLEIITLNGITPVQSVNNYFRVTKAEVLTTGTYGGANAGNILVRGTGGGTSFVQIDTSTGESFSSHFFVPLGFIGFVSGANFSTDSGKIVSLKVQARANANLVTAPFSPLELVQFYDGVTGISHFSYEVPVPINQASDLFITAKTTAGTASVSLEYWGWLIPL